MNIDGIVKQKLYSRGWLKINTVDITCEKKITIDCSQTNHLVWKRYVVLELFSLVIVNKKKPKSFILRFFGKKKSVDRKSLIILCVLSIEGDKSCQAVVC